MHQLVPDAAVLPTAASGVAAALSAGLLAEGSAWKGPVEKAAAVAAVAAPGLPRRLPSRCLGFLLAEAAGEDDDVVVEDDVDDEEVEGETCCRAHFCHRSVCSRSLHFASSCCCCLCLILSGCRSHHSSNVSLKSGVSIAAVSSEIAADALGDGGRHFAVCAEVCLRHWPWAGRC